MCVRIDLVDLGDPPVKTIERDAVADGDDHIGQGLDLANCRDLCFLVLAVPFLFH